MEVGHGQELGFTLGEPFLSGRALAFWAMPITTTIIRNLSTLTRVTAGDVPTERRGAAALDGRHDLQLPDTNVAPIRFTESGAMVAEDIRDLQRWPRHRARPVSRAVRLARSQDTPAG